MSVVKSMNRLMHLLKNQKGAIPQLVALGVLLVGLVATLVVVQQRQDIRQRAQTPGQCEAQCTPEYNACVNDCNASGLEGADWQQCIDSCEAPGSDYYACYQDCINTPPPDTACTWSDGQDYPEGAVKYDCDATSLACSSQGVGVGVPYQCQNGQFQSIND